MLESTKELVERKAQLMNSLSGSDENVKLIKSNIYDRYADVAVAMYTDPVKDGLIRGNSNTFNVLCDSTVAFWAIVGKSSEEYNNAVSKCKELDRLFSSMGEIQKGIKKIQSITGNVVDNITFEQLLNGLCDFKPDRIVPLMDDVEIDIEEYGELDEYKDVKEEVREDIKNVKGKGYKVDITPDINKASKKILNIYEDLFRVGFEVFVPYGILTNEGILQVDDDNTVLMYQVSSLCELYNLINSTSGDYIRIGNVEVGCSVSSELRKIIIDKKINYYPSFQLLNLYGIMEERIESWEEFSLKVEEGIKDNIRYYIENGNSLDMLMSALTTCIVVSEYNYDSAIKLRVYAGSGFTAEKFKRDYERVKNSIFSGIGSLEYINQFESGVVELVIVFDKDMYGKRPIFAYEVMESLLKRGKKPSLSEMIIGQDLSGKMFKVNLNKQEASVVLIGAGPRSGKGVLTLNLVGGLLANGCPLVYLDCKPDMSDTIWEVASKHNINPAVWDAAKVKKLSKGEQYNGGRYNSIVRSIEDGEGAPDGAAELTGIFDILMYLKVVQLMLAAAHLRVAKGIKVGDDRKPVFIFDEILALQTNIYSLWPLVYSKASDKKDNSELAQWCRHIVNWVFQLSCHLSSTINSQLPASGISSIWLFQAIQPESWNSLALDSLHGKFKLFGQPIKARTSIKLLGRGTTDSAYGLGDKKIQGNVNISKYITSDTGSGRHFAYTEVQKVTDMMSLTIFKPYLVLNTLDTNHSCMKNLKENVTADILYKIAPKGVYNPKIAFEGFMELLGKDTIQNLRLGREFLEEVMRNIGLGHYKCVEDYIYDGDIKSFKSLGELLNDNGVDSIREEYELDADVNYQDNVSSSKKTIEYRTISTKDDKQLEQEIKSKAGLQYDSNINTTSINSNVNDKQLEIERLSKLELDRQLNQNNVSSLSEEDIKKALSDSSNNDILREIIIQTVLGQSACDMGGNNGRRNIVNTSQTRNYSFLSNQNSIDCRNANVTSMNIFDKMFLDTPAGAERYIKKLWKSILDNIVSNGYRSAYITRVSIYGGQMYVNGKIVNLNGVIGGYEDIRLRDIVSLRLLCQKFFMIRELRIDNDIFRVAMLELGDEPIEELFKMASKLEAVYVQLDNGMTNIFERDKVNKAISERLKEKAKLENNLDLHCANNKSKKWKESIASQNIWGLKLAKNAMGRAGEMFLDKNKPQILKAAAVTGFAGIVSIGGATLWGMYKLLKGGYTLFNNFNNR